MKFTTVAALAASLGLASATPVSLEARSTVQGFDISSYQPNVNFKSAYSGGARFVIIKATEGHTYVDPTFSKHYTGATSAGLIRGGYHFAHPDSSSGAAQAEYFLAHGGGWSKDGKTLPGALDIEYNPTKGGNECYGLSHAAMVAWIKDFSNTYHKKTTRYPIIYSTADWWKTCTGNSAAFHTTNPFWVAHPGSSVGPLAGGWTFETIWQNTDKSKWGGDGDVFNGSLAQLKKLATG